MARTDLTLVRPPTTLVDACVILDLTTNDPKWADWSEEAIARAADEGRSSSTPIVYAEVSVDFTSIEELDEALDAADLRREPLGLVGESSGIGSPRPPDVSAPWKDLHVLASPCIGSPGEPHTA